MFRIVFLCTGNLCRSPMAEGFLKNSFDEDTGDGHGGSAKAAGIVISSAGTHAGGGLSASPAAVDVCSKAGIDISSHKSRPLTSEILSGSDLVLAMEMCHLLYAVGLMPECAGKAYILSEFAGMPEPEGVADPIGGGAADYRQAYEQIASLLRSALPRIRRMAEGSA